jgi:hypothetical protein
VTGETTRIAGFRHVILHARSCRKNLEVGRLGPAVYEWGAARAHFGFISGLLESSRFSLAGRLLRLVLLRLGERLERAVTPAPAVPGYIVMEPIQEALAALGMTETERTNIAARAAADIVRRWEVRERT